MQAFLFFQGDILIRILSFLLCFLFIFPNTAFADEIEISAQSAVVMDAYTKTVLYEKNADISRAVASTTKIMTCLIACESGRLSEKVVISEKMLKDAEGSSIYLEVGDEISLYDLVCGAMIASGNDAANAIAFFLTGSLKAFEALMNKRAKELGMSSTKFVTPSGLDKNKNHSTAYDMALLAVAALENEELMKISSMKSAEISINGEKQTIYNHNKLLSSSDNFIGLKTGYTERAGRCLVSCCKYASNVIITVTLNAPDDWEDHKRLVKRCKKCYKYISQKQIFRLSVVGGEREEVKALSEYKIKAIESIKVKRYYYPFFYAPISRGDILGREDIYIGKRLVKSVYIKSQEDIKRWQIMR